MRTTSSFIADKFRNVVARVGASFRAQREIEARRVLHQYRQLIAQPREPLPANEVLPVSNAEESPDHADRPDAHEHAAERRIFEGA